jgi:hypothetical protein
MDHISETNFGRQEMVQVTWDQKSAMYVIQLHLGIRMITSFVIVKREK